MLLLPSLDNSLAFRKQNIPTAKKIMTWVDWDRKKEFEDVFLFTSKDFYSLHCFILKL